MVLNDFCCVRRRVRFLISRKVLHLTLTVKVYLEQLKFIKTQKKSPTKKPQELELVI